VLEVLSGCIRLLRIPHWVKNGFVLAPLVFGGELTNLPILLKCLEAFLSMSLMSGGVYVMNDWLDRLEDRAHPQKRHRPIASGLITGPQAALLATLILGTGLALAYWLVAGAVFWLQISYLAVNMAYSLELKRRVILDVVSIAAGFVIRVLAGAYAANVVPSQWLLLCTFLLALFLGCAKRYRGLLLDNPVQHRPVLAYYSLDLIKKLDVILCSCTAVCYAIYTMAPDTVGRLGTNRLVYTAPFVIYGLFRFLYLVHGDGDTDSPVEIVMRDRPLLACILAWVLACAALIYL